MLPGKVVTSTVLRYHWTVGGGRPRARHGSDEMRPKSPSVSNDTFSCSSGFSVLAN